MSAEPITRSLAAERQALSNPSSFVASEIDKLAAGVQDETIPTEFAHRNARRIVEAAYQILERKLGSAERLPAPTFTTDDAGGIRLGWRSGAKQVRVSFGAAPEPATQTYLYFESPVEHHVENLDTENLAERLSWLMAG
jgi:hypothetical protein